MLLKIILHRTGPKFVLTSLGLPFSYQAKLKIVLVHLYLTDIVLLVLQLISPLLLLHSASVLFPILEKPTVPKLN